jgi:hypothetical protein
MRRRSMLGFLLLNILVSLAVVLLVVNVINPQNSGGQPQQIVITVPILVTATIDPQATTPVLIVTATPRPGEPQQIDIPPGILDDPTAQARAIAANLTAAIARPSIRLSSARADRTFKGLRPRFRRTASCMRSRRAIFPA